MSKQLESATLAQFIGTEEYHRYSPLFRNVLLTDGANYVAETAGAFWLMDVIGSYQPSLRNQPFQVWKVIPYQNGANVVCEDGNKNVIKTQRIPYTDFPFIDGEEFVLWAACNEQYLVIMLPSEY